MAAGYDGALMFNTNMDATGFNKGTKSITNQLNGLSSCFKKLGIVMAGVFAIKGLTSLATQAINLASDIQEVQNVVDTAFGDMAYMAEDFAKTATENFGMSKLSAKQFASTYMAMGKGMGIASKEAADMAIATTGRIGDVASFYNKSFSEVDTMMKSIWTGETESLKQIGVVMTETNLQAFALSQGINKNIASMTQAEKTQLRYAFVMQQTSLAAGDFVKTQDSWANQTRILSERWKELLSILGTGLIQVLAPVVKMLNAVMSKLIDFANTFSAATARLFGKQHKISIGTNVDSQPIEQAAAAEGDLAKATDEATKAAKNNTAAFDDLNVLNQDVASSAGSAAGAGGLDLGGINPSEVEDETSSTEEEVSGFTKKILDLLKPLQEINLDNLNLALGKLKNALEPFADTIGAGLEWFYRNVLVPLAKWTIEEVLPRFLEGLAYVLEILNGVIELAKPGFKWLWDNMLKPLAEWTGSFLIDDLDLLVGLLETLAGLLNGDTKEATDGAQRAFKALGGIIEDVLIRILGQEAVESIENFVSEWANRIAAWWNNDVVPWFDSAKWAALFDSVRTTFFVVWDNIQVKSAEVWGNITEVWGKAASWFSQKVIEPIKNAFKSGINMMIGFAEGFVNCFISGINGIIDAINSISFDLPEMLGGEHVGFSLNPVDTIKLPRLATGAVIPPNAEFAAILGDQKNGRNLEAPEWLIRQIVREETEGLGGGDININATGNWGQMIRMMKFELDKENKRQGKNLIRGLTKG